MTAHGPYGNPQLSPFSVWPTLEDFYRADERRRDSAGRDFPGLPRRWTDRSRSRWIVFFMSTTSELVAQQVDHHRPVRTRSDNGPVVLLGSLPHFQHRSLYDLRVRPTRRRDVPLSLEHFNDALADIVVGDILALTRDPDFMAALASRIEMSTRLLAELFHNPESPIYDLPLIEIDRRLERREIVNRDQPTIGEGRG